MGFIEGRVVEAPRGVAVLVTRVAGATAVGRMKRADTGAGVELVGRDILGAVLVSWRVVILVSLGVEARSAARIF